MPLLVEHRAGAGGSVGMDALARAAPDGYTLAFSAISPLTLQPLLARVRYDPLRAFTPVASVMRTPVLVVGTPALGGRAFASPRPTAQQLQYIQAGRLQALAVGAPARLEVLPQVPTLAELGFAQAHLASLFGIFAPARTPASVVQRLNAEIHRALEGNVLRERLREAHNLPAVGSVEAFAREIALDRQHNQALVAGHAPLFD